jgi:hypothetical protein
MTNAVSTPYTSVRLITTSMSKSRCRTIATAMAAGRAAATV